MIIGKVNLKKLNIKDNMIISKIQKKKLKNEKIFF